MNKSPIVGVALLVLAIPAHANIISFDGYSSFVGKGNTGKDAQGNAWLWNTTKTGLGAWGVPGLGNNAAVFNTKTGDAATEFSIAFSIEIASILETPSPGPSGYNEFTRFSSEVGGVWYAWTPTYDGTKSVNFEAPAGVSLTNGEDYFVNVVFNKSGVNGGNAGFSASFASAVPELSTWAMVLCGFGGFAFAGYRRRAVAA